MKNDNFTHFWYQKLDYYPPLNTTRPQFEPAPQHLENLYYPRVVLQVLRYQKRRWNKSWYGYKLVNSKRNPRNSSFHVISWLLFTFSSINCQQNIEVPNPECWRKYGLCFLLEQSSILLSYFWRRVALLMLPTLEMSFHHYSLIPPLSSVYKTCCFHS